jgi:hypothetical protein
MAWDYAKVEEALALLHRVPAEVRNKAFRARLQHLQKLGVPLDLKPGKGRKISYSEDEVFQWALCLELAEYNIIPLVITNTIKTYWKSHLLDAFSTARQAEKTDDILARFSPPRSWIPGRSRETEIVGLGEPTILQGMDALRRPLPGKLNARRVINEQSVNISLPSTARSFLVVNVSQIIRDLRRLRFILDWKEGERIWPVPDHPKWED